MKSYLEIFKTSGLEAGNQAPGAAAQTSTQQLLQKQKAERAALISKLTENHIAARRALREAQSRIPGNTRYEMSRKPIIFANPRISRFNGFPNVERLEQALKDVQTGNYSNPFIRTTVKDNLIHTNYGPVQLGVKLLDLPPHLPSNLNYFRHDLLLQGVAFKDFCKKKQLNMPVTPQEEKMFGPGGTGNYIKGNAIERQNRINALNTLGKYYIVRDYNQAVKDCKGDPSKFWQAFARHWRGSKNQAVNDKYARKLRGYYIQPFSRQKLLKGTRVQK